MFHAAGLPFLSDGVSPDLVQAGEPRLVRYRGADAPLPVRATTARRVPVLRRLLRPASA